MDEATHIEVQQWLLKAEHDLQTARLLLNNDEPIRDTGVYHCQQVAEKLLKGFLTYCEVPFSKTHDLTILTEACRVIDPSFGGFSDAADILTPYAIVFRYPGDVLEPSEEDAQEALEFAEKFFAFVTNKLVDYEKDDDNE